MQGQGQRGWRNGLLASRFRVPLLLATAAVAYGVIGYWLLEHFSFIDALYMTVTTLTTVAYNEVRPLDTSGRVFTMSLIALGVMAVFNLLTTFASVFASGEFGEQRRRRSMQRKVDGLKDHYVVCAFGRVGRAAVRELSARRAPLVVIEPQAEVEAQLEQAAVPYLIADPAEEGVLEAAGITRAKALLCAVDSDASNVYITLTARYLNPKLFIVARASSPESIAKLERAGANRVVSPYLLSGSRMASLALRPAMVEFVDMVSVAPDLRVEMVDVRHRSRLASQTVKEACAPYEGVMILALKKQDGQLFVPPRGDTMISEGDLLIAVGPVSALSELEELKLG